MKDRLTILSVLGSLFLAAGSLHAECRFEFQLEKPTAASAGVFAPDGRMIRLLWSD